MNILFFLTPKEEVAHVDEDDTLRQVVEKVEHHGYSAIPLLARDGKYIGTITEGDLLWEMREKDFPDLHRMEKIRITDLKRHRDNEPVKISESMENLFEKITNQNFVPVVMIMEFLSGSVTRKDVLLYLAKKLKSVEEGTEQERE